MLVWYHIKVVCFHSLTVVWTYLLMALGCVIATILSFPEISNNLGLQNYLSTETASWYMFGIGFLTLMARFRSILWKTRKHKAIWDNDEDEKKPSEIEVEDL